MIPVYAENHDCIAIRDCTSTTTLRYYVTTSEDELDTVLVSEIQADNNDMPIPRKGDRIIFDMDFPVNNDMAHDDYISYGEIYKVKRVYHCYNGTNANTVIEIIMEIDDAD